MTFIKKRKTERTPRTKVVRPAAAAIDDALKLYGIREEIRANRLITEWNELVGAHIASKTRPIGVTDRVLIVEVISSPWMQELHALRAKLLLGLIERFGPPSLFDDLKFRLAGRTRRESMPPRPPVRRDPPPKVLVPATAAEREAIVRDVAAVDDLELRELIARVRISSGR